MALDQSVDKSATWESLGVCPEICETAKKLGFKRPTKIQVEAIPAALSGKDIIGVAQTGSGKTAAFAIPIIQDLIQNPNRRMFACVLAPTRELANQIAEQFEALGECIKLKCTVVVGGIDVLDQAISVAKKPHVIIGTPGRLIQHLEETKGFSVHTIKYLVMDEADRLLDLQFEEPINKLLKIFPKERHTYLFSATMTSKVSKLQRASLTDPAKVEVSKNYSTVDTLTQQYVFLPQKHKDSYCAFVLNEFAGNTAMVFVATCSTSQKLTLVLRELGFGAIPLNGDMDQRHRFLALEKFRSGARNILVATDVASRGIDIPMVDLVINYDLPIKSEDYVHRVGRTARAGRGGRAITLVTQYDLEVYQRIEALIEKKLDAFPAPEEQVLVLADRVAEAQRSALARMKEDVGERVSTEDGGEEVDELEELNDDEIGVGGGVKRRNFGGGGGHSKKRRGGGEGGKGEGGGRGGRVGRVVER
eukprot:Phypoly_transcript_06187.p1 GENE.Phypoly_transcript_06187~~Phypoly_transcript_06187.p1  ORF type:complete len:476 (-),score=98.76 Phypoly_transcript_06187:307-1734(-)